MAARISVVLSVVLAIVFAHQPCAAEPGPPPLASPLADGPAQRMSLVVADDGNETELLGAVTTELLARLSVGVQLQQVEHIDLAEIANPRRPNAHYLACAYVDLRTAGTATLYLVDPIHDRVLVRRVERTTGGEELAREQLGQILETSAEGLLAGARIGQPRQEVAATLAPQAGTSPEPASAAAALPARTKSSFAHLSALYEGEVMTAGAVAHGPVLGLLGQRAIAGTRIGVWLLAHYRWPYELEARPVGAKVSGGALRLLATLDLPDGASWSWRFAIGAGPDFVELRPTSAGAQDVTLARSRWLTFAIGRAELLGRLSIGGTAHILAAAFADLDPSDTSYVFSARDGQQIVMRPWPVRPGLSLGLELP